MTIIKASKSNIDELVELIYLNKKSQSHYKGFLPRKNNYREVLKQDILTNLESSNYSYFLAIDDNEKSKGVITVNTYEKAGIIGILGVLTNLYVDESCRGNGVAKNLVEQAIKWSKEKGVTILEIDVFINNITAQKFWNNLGFEDRLTIKVLEI